jgi:hypothetical protein
MLEAAAKRISELVGADARVLQVGASAEVFARADDVLDDRPHEPHGDARFTRATWTTRDVCARAPWPYADGQFDFAVCLTLHRLRDPVGVCAELARVARAGYVELPVVEAELADGSGRWLCDVADAGLVFTAKPPPDARVRVPRRRVSELPPEERVHALFWEDRLPARERLADDGELLAELADRIRERFEPSGAEVALSEARRVGGLAGSAALRSLDAIRASRRSSR